MIAIRRNFNFVAICGIFVILLCARVTVAGIYNPTNYRITVDMQAKGANCLTKYVGNLKFDLKVSEKTNKLEFLCRNASIGDVKVTLPGGDVHTMSFVDDLTFAFGSPSLMMDVGKQYEILVVFKGKPRVDKKGFHKISYCEGVGNDASESNAKDRYCNYIISGFHGNTGALSFPFLNATETRANLTLTVTFPNNFQVVSSGTFTNLTNP